MASRRRFRLWAIGLGTPLLIIVILVLFWDWNWLRPLAQRQASSALGRPIAIGHFDVRLARQPLLVFDSVTIPNPENFPGDKTMGTIDRLSVRVDIGSLFHGPILIPEIAIERPNFALAQAPSGTANWQFGDPNAPKSDKPAPQIGSLIITAGKIHVVAGKPQADFALNVETRQPAKGDEAALVIEAKGTYANQPVDGKFIGGALLSLRDPAKPYPIDLTASNGGTHVALKGTVERPMEFAGANVTLDLRGRDLADLYSLTGIPLAPTPAYHLTGKLDYSAAKILFRQFAGTVGASDLNGDIGVEIRQGDLPLVTGDLTSRKLVMADLAGFIGATPGKADAKNDTHQAERKQAEASPKLLPDTPINLPKLRSADIEVKYRGERIESQSTPIDNLSADLSVENGQIRLHPLSFAVGTGQIALNLTLDAQGPLVHLVGDADFHKVDVGRLMKSTGVFEGAGTIGGQIKIDTTGNSLAAMLGQGNGDVKLFMTGGDISALLVNLAGLDFGNSLLSLLGLPNRAPVRCMIFDAGLAKGDLQSRLFLVDTTEANVIGKGHIDLAQEQVDYQLTTDPKHFSIGAIPAPIDIKGTLKSPGIAPDPTALAERGGAAAVLGVLLTPLGALIPTIQLGLGEDSDCKSLLQDVGAGAKTPTKPVSGKPTVTKNAVPTRKNAPAAHH
ncbi:MAG: AsmA family protein [Rhodospirillales bacterium]|nr:AsmA family protein [Rhodospirillales bacterium]